MRALRAIAAMAGVALLSGCFGGAAPDIRYYTMAIAPVVESAETTAASLGVRPLDYARYYKQKLVYRTGASDVAFREFDQWAELPRDTITRGLIDAAIRSGRFADVGYTFDLARPTHVLTGELRRFDEAVQAGGGGAALCEVRLELRERGAGTLVWSATMRMERPIEQEGRAGFVSAMNGAVSQLVGDAVKEIGGHVQ